MLKPKMFQGASFLPRVLPFLFIVFSSVNGKVENSFQSSQYSQPQYKDYYSSTPSYQYPDLTVKSVSSGDISSSPILGDHQDSLLAQGTAQQPAVHGAPNQHVYYYETYPMQDTSRGNVYNVPGGNKRCTYMGNGNMRCYSRQDSSYGVMNDYDTTGSEGGDGSGLGGLAGLVGLLGLKGLKGLASVIIPAIFPILFPLIFPLLLPVLLPLLLALALPILLLPIPVISVPAPIARSLGAGISEARKLTTGVFERVVSTDECIERISCEISKLSQKRKAGEWMEKALNFLPENSSITKRIHKGFFMINGTSSDNEGKSDQHTCSRMKCKMLSIFDSPSG